MAEPALQQLSHLSSCDYSPRGLRAHHSVHDRQQFSHASGQGHLGRFAGCAEALVERANDGIPAGRRRRSHEQHRANGSATTPNCAMAAQRAAVAGQGCHAHQGGNFLATESPQLGQFGQEGAARDRSDPRDALQQIVLGPPERTGSHGLVQIFIDAAELALEPANVVGEAAPHRAAGMEQPILLGDQHFNKLAPARDQRLQALACLIRQRPGLGAHPFGEQREHRGVDRIRLGQLAGSTGEVAHLPRIRDDHRHAGTGQGRRQRLLVSPCCLEHDQRFGPRAESLQQACNSPRIVGDLPTLATGAQRNIQRIFGHIDADKHRRRSHETSDAKAARLDPALHDAGLGSQATVRARDEQTADDAPAKGRSFRPGARRAIARQLPTSHDAPCLLRYKGTDNETMANDQTIPVILSACRTPIGKFLGGLSPLPGPRLGALVIREAVRRAAIADNAVEEVIMGNVLQGGEGQAPARQAAIHSGLPGTIPAMTINKVCGSGLKAVMLAAQAIKAGVEQCLVAGGFESMSNVPHYVYGMRGGIKAGNRELVDGMIRDGLWDSFSNTHMGNLAEYTAKKAAVSRLDQDRFALASHQKAAAAMAACRFKAEIVPVEVPGKKGPTVVEKDEGPRKETSLDALAALNPSFQKGGTVTPGNAPGLNDGASALVVTSLAFAKAHGVKPLARVTAYASAGGDPKDLFFAPIVAVQKLLAKTQTKIDDYDLIEANEAFAVQAIADGRALGWDWDRVNVNGGAIALGHPIGASGARLLTTLLFALKDRKQTTGLATLCLGGGNAVALSVEML